MVTTSLVAGNLIRSTRTKKSLPVANLHPPKARQKGRERLPREGNGKVWPLKETPLHRCILTLSGIDMILILTSSLVVLRYVFMLFSNINSSIVFLHCKVVVIVESVPALNNSRQRTKVSKACGVGCETLSVIGLPH
jgi:hypothetical protein